MFGGWGARQAVSASSDSFKNPGMNEATEGLRMDARLGNVAPRNRAMATGNTVNVSPRHSDPLAVDLGGLVVDVGVRFALPPKPSDRAPESGQQESAKLTGAAGVLARWDIGRRGEPCRRRW